MHRSTRRRFIVLITLLSHLMAALLVHVPMAYAAAPSEAATSSSPPCHDEMQMDHSAGQAADESHPMSHSDATDHGPGCKSGPCKCPCAHAQALAFAQSFGSPAVAHTLAPSHYDVLLAPDCGTSVFRPPIA